jgi:hypothetical protein
MFAIAEILTHFLENLTPGHFEGLLLYICGAITITWVQLHFKNQVVEGLKGENGKWEAPEWLVYISAWIFPHMIMANGFLGMSFSLEAWLLIGSLTMFGLTGRWGLEWLYSMKTGNKPTEKTE